MWKRKVIKKKAMALMKQGYFRILPVCFLIAMLTTAYSFSTTFLNLQVSSGSLGNDAAYVSGIPNSEAILDIAVHLLEGTALSGILNGILYDFLSMIIDLFSTNISVFFSFIRTANYFLTDGFSSVLIFSAITILFALVYQIFVSNILLIGEKRFFMENRNYPQTAISKIFFLYKLRYLRHPAWIMFSRTLFQSVWNLTIVGGIIKHYEYSMIPFILAENPRISRRDAFFLSRQLTARNKWRLFLLDVSFAGWEILSFLTLGLLDFMFVNPYITICRAELYLSLRRNYVLSRLPGYERLNDSYLEHVPSEDELLISKALYDDSNGPYTKTSYFAPEQYPVFLFSVQPPLRAVRPPLRDDRKYEACAFLFLFHAFSLFGCLLETALHLIQNGSLDTNTAVFPPWMPIYGVFGILLLVLAKRMLKKPAFVFLSSFALYAVLEYLFNLGTELAFGSPLRDYSVFFLNLNGHVYVGGAAAFGLLGCAFLYCLAPRWTELFMKLGRAARWTICGILTFLFAMDIVFTLL